MSEGIVKERLSGHWYTAEAKPCHTVVGVNGKERSTTLRDARKMNLYPSVTTILKTLAAPQLTRWLVENAIIAAVTTERRDDEDETAFARRIAEEAGEVAGNAANFGTRFHSMMEDLLTGNPDPAVDDDLVAYLPFAIEWMESNVEKVISAEQVIVGDGYAGTADLFCVTHDGARVLFDFKTKSLNRGDDGEWKVPRKPYDSWCHQLAAYGEVLQADAVCNVIVNSHEPGAFYNLYHSEEARSHSWEVFQGVRDLWQLINKYSPETNNNN